jgi:SET domain-containing protein
MVFLVPTVVKRSEIEGFGVFTTTPIAKGTKIWAFEAGLDWEITPEQMDKFPEPYKARLLIWAYKDKRGMWIVCNDAAKFMNHSDRANCDDVSDPIYTIAARDIAAGEELTCDYNGFHHGDKLF